MVRSDGPEPRTRDAQKTEKGGAFDCNTSCRANRGKLRAAIIAPAFHVLVTF
jgi:hypothetical protein